MPWKGKSVMEERVRFVVRLLEGEEISFLCREFGISRKTGLRFTKMVGGEGFEPPTKAL